MGKGERKRHIFLSVPARIAEHHTLVAGSLLKRVHRHDSPVYVRALLVQCGEDSTGIAIEHVLGLVVADFVDYSSGCGLNVHVCIFRTDLAADNHKPGAAECLASYLGLRILAEKFIKNGI